MKLNSTLYKALWTGCLKVAKMYLVWLFAVLFSIEAKAQTSKSYTTAGLDSFQVPAGVTKVMARAIGAGGRGSNTSVTNKGGGGGGGGAFAQDSVSVTPGAKYAVFVGYGSADDDPGDSSWFKNITTVMAKGGQSVVPTNTNGGGSGGSAISSVGSFKRTGGNGATGDDVTFGGFGGGGGSSASYIGDGVNGNNQTGATAPSGGGNGANGAPNTGGDGSNGLQPGGGGGGSYSLGSAQAGGSGADGKVQVSFDCPIYSLSSTTASGDICDIIDSVQINLSAASTDLPVGIYTVTYNIDGGGNQTATFTVTTAGSASFYATGLTSVGDRLVTITTLVSGESDLCSSSISANNTVTVHVNALPVISGTTSICKDSTTQLTSDSAANVSSPWVSSNPSKATITSGGLVSAVDSGTVDIYFTDDNGCRDTITITITAPPNAGTISGTDSVCIGSTTSLSSGGDAGGTWESSNTAVATVDGSGLVSGAAAGTATIRYIVTGTGGCTNDTATYTVVVSTPPNAGTISGTDSVCIGSTTSLSSGGDAGGTWESSNTAVATVDGSGLVSGAAAGTATIRYIVTGTGGCTNDTATYTVAVSTPPNAGTITGTDSVCVGSTTSLSSDGDTGGTWESSSTSVATVDGSGLVSGAAAGTATIRYIVTGIGGCTNDTATYSVKVSSPPSAGTITGTDSVCVGSTTSLSSDGDAGGTWESGNTSVATVNGSGLVSGVAAGTATIRYIVTGIGGCTNDTATYSVKVSAPPSAGTITGTDSVCVGSTTSLSSDGDTGGTWESSSTSVATVDGSGLVSGVAAGTATIRYIVTGAGGCTNDTATYSVKVSAPPSAGTITGTDSVCVGSTTSLSSDGDAGGTWESGNTSVATIDGSGLVSGVAAGTATIRYIVTGIGGCTNDTATYSVKVSAPPSAGTITGTDSVCVGSTTSLSSDGDTGGTWESGNTSVATIDGSGLVSGVAAGTATIRYIVTGIGGCTNDTATYSVKVSAPPSAGTITGTDSVCVGSTTSLSSDGDAGGTWESGNTSVATVNGSGLVSGVAAGTATIRYIVTGIGGCTNDTATYSVKVSAPPSAGTITGTDSVCVGSTTSLSSDGDTGGTWESGNTSVATIDGSGLVSGVAAGTATIRYIVTGIGGCTNDTATYSVKVSAPPSAGTITGTDSVCVGSTTSLSSDGDAGGTWESGNTSVATVNGSGLVSGVAAGTATISYIVTGGACANDTATFDVTVTAAPNAGTISVVLGNNPLCLDSSLIVSTDGDISGSWYSSNTSVLTISPIEDDYIVTAIDTGHAQIYYVVTGSGGCGNDTAFLDITVNPSTIITTQPVGDTLCNDGSTTTLSVDAEGLSLQYAWYSSADSAYLDPTPGSPDGTGATFDPPAQSVDTTIYYYAIVSGECGSDTSDIVAVHTQICTAFSELTTTINSPHSGVYSDTIWVRTHLVDSVSQLPVTDVGLPILFTIYNGNDPSVASADTVTGYTDGTGFARAYLKITQDPDWTDTMDDRNGDNMHIRAYFAGNETYGSAERVDNFNVRKETAEFVPFTSDESCLTCANIPDAKKIKFNGKTGSGYIKINTNSTSVTIQVKIKDESDGMSGNITRANVRFELNPSGTTTPLVKYTRPSSVDSVATVTFDNLTAGSYGSNSYTVHVTVGDYYRARLNSTLTIHKNGVASLFSGGGDILQASGSTGKYPGDPGTLSSFSIGSKFNNTATKVQGKASLIFTSKGRTYEVTGSGTPTVTFDSVGGVASYVTAASIADITLDTTTGSGVTSTVNSNNLTLTLNMKDSATDMIAIKVAEGTTVWYTNSGTGSSTNRQELIRGGMTIASPIAAPTATSVSRCGPGSVTMTATPPSGATVDWYDAPTGGTQLLRGATTYTSNVGATATFYVEARNTLTSALSASRTPVTVTIKEQPALPAASGNTRCGTGTLALTATPPANSTIAWYSAATGGSSLSTSTSYTTPSISATTTYYVEAKLTATGCVSASRTSAVATVNPLPTAPVAGSASNCGPGSLTIKATPPSGAGVEWYTASTAGTLLGTGTTYVTPNLTATTTYYALSKNSTTGCISSTRTVVSATINPIPAATTSITGTLSTCPISTSSYTYTATKVSGAASYKWTIPSCATGTSTTNAISVKFSKAGATDSVFVQTVASTGCLSLRKGVRVTSAICSTCVVSSTITSAKVGFKGSASISEAGMQGIQGMQEVQGMRVAAYPNPSKGKFLLSMQGFEQAHVVIKVINTYGGVVYTRDMYLAKGQGLASIDMGNTLAKGTYFIQVMQKDKVKVVKFMKD